MTTPTLETVPEETVTPVAAPAATPGLCHFRCSKNEASNSKKPWLRCFW